MMRAMREITKPVFWIVAITFIGWLAYGQVTEFIAGGRDVVLKVGGTVVRSQPFQQQYQAALEQYRHQQGGARLTREDEQQVQNQVADQFIQKILLDRAYLPQQKLQEYLTADIYVSDAKLWRIWRDQHEAVTVALLALGPGDVPDTLAPLSDAELQRYYETHKKELKRLAIAWLSFVAEPRVPDAADTATALAQVRRLHAEITAGKAKFADVAKKESADSASGAQGGDLGWVKREGSGFDRQFVAAMVRLKPGELSQPVLTQFGYHLIRVDAAKGDSLHVRHILVPIVLQGKHLDMVDARTDTLDRLAAAQTEGTKLDAAARALGLPLAPAPKLVQGDRLTLGKYVVPDVGVWAFEATPGETSPVIEGER